VTAIDDNRPMLEPLDEQVDHVRGETEAAVIRKRRSVSGGYEPWAFIEALAR
jgi:hypothetical protein